jgi:hypothetical protein
MFKIIGFYFSLFLIIPLSAFADFFEKAEIEVQFSQKSTKPHSPALKKLVQRVWQQREEKFSGNDGAAKVPDFLSDPTLWNLYQEHLKNAFTAAERFKKRAQEVGQDLTTLSYKPNKSGRIIFKDAKMTSLFTECYAEYEKAQQKLSRLAFILEQKEDESSLNPGQAINKAEKNEVEPLDQEENDQRLPELNSTQQAVNFTRFYYYDSSLTEEGWFRSYNSKGHILPTEELSTGFLKGHYQHYVYRFIKLNYNYNYLMFDGSQPPRFQLADYDIFTKLLSQFNEDVPFFKKDMGLPFQRSSELWARFKKVYAALHKAEGAFKRNSLLIKLGTAYQRRKIIVGKMESLRLQDSTLSFRERLAPYLKREGTLEKDLQTMMFHCLKEGFLRLKSTLMDHLDDEEFLSSFDSFQPSFVVLPYYHKIINQLDELIKPAPEIGPFKL